MIFGLGDKSHVSAIAQQKADALGAQSTINFSKITGHNFSKHSGISGSPDLSDLRILQDW
jgi:hypothetical protein